MHEQIHAVVMPKWGLSMTSGRVVEWLVGEGDVVDAGTELLEIETEKSTGSVEANRSGLVRRLVALRGEEVPVGCTIALLAPPEVAESEIDEAAALARDQIVSGPVEEENPVRTVAVTVDGRSINSIVVGDGDDLVLLIHGYGGDKYSWQFVQSEIAVSRMVYALDLPGHGASTKDVGDASLEFLAKTVLGFMEATEIRRAHLVGHSLGGAVAIAVAARSPERVQSLTLVAPAGVTELINAEYLREFSTAATRRQLRPVLAQLFANERFVTSQMVEELLRFKRLDGAGSALAALLSTLLQDDHQALDLRSTVQGLAIRPFVVWGENDQVLPRPSEAMINAEFRLVPDAGHMVQLEQPDEVVRAVEAAITASAR